MLAPAATAAAAAVTGGVDHCEREVGQDTPLSEARSREGGKGWKQGGSGAGPAKVHRPGCPAVPGRVFGPPESALGNAADS